MNSKQTFEMGSTSRSLLARVKQDDQDAWRKLTELYGPLIYSWCRRSRLSAEDSADILQDVFRSVVLNVASFDAGVATGSFRGWLWTITRNKVRDHLRTRLGKAEAAGGSDAQRMMSQVTDHEFSESSEMTDSLPDGLAYRALNIIRGEIQETTWIAFWRTTIDDIAPAAVAQELGISVHSVWQAKSRVLRRARQLLETSAEFSPE
ncbi:MAG: sigma-70 family RNA polymerase sigma factor [Pirellulaceae bacterium]